MASKQIKDFSAQATAVDTDKLLMQDVADVTKHVLRSVLLADHLPKDGSVALTADWDAGAFKITADRFLASSAGSPANVALGLNNSINTGFYKDSLLFEGILVAFNGVSSGIALTNAGFRYNATSNISFSADGNPLSSTTLILARDADNVFAQRNGINAQTSRIYKTFTDASNYERLAITSNTIAVESAGTGAANIDLTLTPKGTGSVSTTSLLLSNGIDLQMGLVGSGGNNFTIDTLINASLPVINITIDAKLPLAIKKSTAAVFAPGAGFGGMRWEAGTNAGTLKLVAFSGTSTTGVTIVDNVGAGN